MNKSLIIEALKMYRRMIIEANEQMSASIDEMGFTLRGLRRKMEREEGRKEEIEALIKQLDHLSQPEIEAALEGISKTIE